MEGGGHNVRIFVPFWEVQPPEESPNKGHCEYSHPLTGKYDKN
jgi:hypothetical protein